jgi:hypothetical protein
MGCFDALCVVCSEECLGGAGLHRSCCYLAAPLRQLLSSPGRDVLDNANFSVTITDGFTSRTTSAMNYIGTADLGTVEIRGRCRGRRERDRHARIRGERSTAPDVGKM